MRRPFWPATGPMHRGLMMSNLLALMSYSPSISSAGGSPARTSPPPGKARASLGADLAYFGSYTVSFARWCPESSCWRTSQLSVNGEAERYAGRWPASGMICGGVAYPQPKWAHLTSVSGGSALGGESARPTPDAGVFNYAESPESFDARRARLVELHNNGNGAGRVLAVEVKRMWPTMRSRESGGWQRDQQGRIYPTLAGATGAEPAWPTPAKQDGHNNSLPPSQVERDSIPGAILRTGEKGYLNPSWVEALMGFPSGWTDIDGPPLRDHSTHGSHPAPGPGKTATGTG